MRSTRKVKRRLRFSVKLGLGVSVLLILFLVLQGPQILHRIQYPHFDDLIEKGYTIEQIQTFHTQLSKEIYEEVNHRPYEVDMLERLTIDHYDALRTIGYSQEEVKQILDLSESLIQYFESHDLNLDWITMVQASNFSETHFERYMAYAQKKPDLDVSMVLSMVNANRDYPLYTHIQAADPSKGVLVLVNKYYKLDSTYIPKLAHANACGGFEMMPEAAASLNQLCIDMKDLNLNVTVSNTYRSYDTQVSIYNRYLEKDTQNVVDGFSARPGHSEHQAGLAVDFKTLTQDITYFESSDAYPWLKENAHTYGFIQRYTEENSNLTGYQAEAWHFRYVGVEVATKLYETKMTLEEYVTLNP